MPFLSQSLHLVQTATVGRICPQYSSQLSYWTLPLPMLPGLSTTTLSCPGTRGPGSFSPGLHPQMPPHMASIPLYSASHLRPVSEECQPTSHPCPSLHLGPKGMAFDPRLTFKGGVQKTGSPVCGPILHHQGYQPSRCPPPPTTLHEGPSHFPCVPP